MAGRTHPEVGPIPLIGRLLLLLVIGIAMAWGPGLASAQEGTPSVASAEGSGLESLLALVPATLPELDEPERATIAYADIAAQLAAVGVTPPADVDDDAFRSWTAATMGLALPSAAAQQLKVWRQDFGFALLQADQTLQISLPPFDLTMYRGRFDEAAVASALGRLGYEPLDAGGKTILSVRDDFEMDLAAPTGYALASMNYAAVLDDGTLVFAPARAIVESVLEVEAGEEESVAERDDVADLLPHVPAGLVSALLVPGLMLSGGLPPSFPDLGSRGTPDIDAIATEVAEQEQMPPIQLALLGMTAGGPLEMLGEALPQPPDTPDARAVVVLLMDGVDQAERAVAIVEERLATGSSAQTGQPYADLFPERVVRPVPDEPIVLIELSFGEETSRFILSQLLFSRDLGFLAW